MTNNKIFWLRLPAFIIDLVFVSVITFLVDVFYFMNNLISPGYQALWFIIAFFYEVIFEMLPSRGTPGLLMFGLRLEFPYTRVPAIRAFWRILMKWLLALPLGLGFISGFFFEDRRTIYDRITGARVVKMGAKPQTKSVPCLIRHFGDKGDEVLPIPEKGFILGRNPQMCNFLFEREEPGISGCHCSITYNSQVDAFMLEDLDSSFGTYTADGIRLSTGKIVPLKAKDIFYLAAPTNSFTVCFKEEPV